MYERIMEMDRHTIGCGMRGVPVGGLNDDTAEDCRMRTGKPVLLQLFNGKDIFGNTAIQFSSCLTNGESEVHLHKTKPIESKIND